MPADSLPSTVEVSAPAPTAPREAGRDVADVMPEMIEAVQQAAIVFMKQGPQGVDMAARRADALFAQARLNVLIELGWFYGHFGRGRICILAQDKTEIPSDLGGIRLLSFHDQVEELALRIGAELERVGVIAAAKPRAARRTSHTSHQRVG